MLGLKDIPARLINYSLNVYHSDSILVTTIMQVNLWQVMDQSLGMDGFGDMIQVENLLAAFLYILSSFAAQLRVLNFTNGVLTNL